MKRNKLTIAICDDDKKTLNIVSNSIQFIFQNNGITSEILTYSDPVGLKNDFEKISFDLAFLDIEMPHMDGVELGRLIKKSHNDVQIIYISNREDRVFDTFDTRPFGFIRKSNFLVDINKVIDLYLESLKNEMPSSITFTCGSTPHTVNISDILYVESQAHIQVIHTTSENYEVTTTFESVALSLRQHGFINCCRGILVNYRYIYTINKETITLSTKEEIPMSRRKVNETKEEYFALVRKNSDIIV